MSAPVVYSRAVLYEDGSGIETGVEFAPGLRLGKDDRSYVRIQGSGGNDVLIRVSHIPHLMDWLATAQDLDYQHRQDVARAAKAASK